MELIVCLTPPYDGAPSILFVDIVDCEGWFDTEFVESGPSEFFEFVLDNVCDGVEHAPIPNLLHFTGKSIMSCWLKVGGRTLRISCSVRWWYFCASIVRMAYCSS